MKRIGSLLAVAIILAIGFAHPMQHVEAAAQNSAQIAQSHDLEKPIYDIRQQIRSWELSADIQVAMVVAVVIFGALISAFHRVQGEWGKRSLLVLGVLTSIVTGISGTDKVFSADYRALRRAVSEANRVVTRLDRINSTPNIPTMSATDFAVVRDEFDRQLDVYEKIVQAVENSGQSSTTLVGSNTVRFFSLPTVEAQSSGPAPAWTVNRPSDSRNLYFVGKSTDTFLAKAKDNSYIDAENQISTAFGLEEPYIPTPAQKTLVQNASTVKDTFFAYNSGSSTYTYFTLVRISRDLQRSQASPLELKQKDWYPVDLTFNPTAGLFALDRDGGVAKVSVDQGSIHLQALFRLPRTSRASALTSNQDSIFVSTSNPTGCTVYQYSLASKKTTTRIVGQHLCDGIATDGKGIFVAFPKDGEIRYWPTWGAPTFQSFDLPESSEATHYCVLHYDSFGQRLLFAGASGRSYALPLPAGKWSDFASQVGYVHSIDADSNHVLFASGSKVLFYARVGNTGENPPVGMRSLKIGTIYGVAVDSSDSVWIVDHDNSLIRGPFPLD